MILIPVHANHHWSLAVVVNLCYMNSSLSPELNSEIPFIMHLVPANAHDPITISNRIRRWLVFEWHLLKGRMGKKNIFMECYSPTITPAVATQSNAYDCALYVCRYALGLYFIQDQTFTYKDVLWKRHRCCRSYHQIFYLDLTKI